MPRPVENGLEARPENPASADKVDAATRSLIMARVKSNNTSSEMAVRRALHAAGYRFRLHRKDLPGNPDIVLPRRRAVVFVHGCLWHGHKCRRFRWPVSNAEYWRKKIGRNMDRDRAATTALERLGWRVFVVWDCALEAEISLLLAGLRDERGE